MHLSPFLFMGTSLIFAKSCSFLLAFDLLHVLAVTSWYHFACASYSYQVCADMTLPHITYQLPEHCLRVNRKAPVPVIA